MGGVEVVIPHTHNANVCTLDSAMLEEQSFRGEESGGDHWTCINPTHTLPNPTSLSFLSDDEDPPGLGVQLG